MTDRPAISVFFPFYNDAGTAASMIVGAVMTLEALSDDWEVIGLNDGSSDATAEILDEVAAKYPNVRIIHHPKNLGYGGNLRSGFKAATKDWVFYTDGDAQYDVRELANLVAALGPGVDLVNGYKIQRSDPVHRIIVGKAYQWVIKLGFGLRLRDVDCDFRLIRRSLFDKFELSANDGEITVELMRKIQDTNCHMVEIPVHHFHRTYGQSQFFNFGRVQRTLKRLMVLWVQLIAPRFFGRTPRPVRVGD